MGASEYHRMDQQTRDKNKRRRKQTVGMNVEENTSEDENTKW